MVDIKRYSDSYEIEERSIRVYILPASRDAIGSYKITIHDDARPIKVNDDGWTETYPNCDETLQGITETQAREFFDTICQLLESGANTEEVYIQVENYASKLKSGVEETRKAREEEEKIKKTAHEETLRATHLPMQKTVNGIKIIVCWYNDHQRYEIYLPQIDFLKKEQVAPIGEERKNAELVFEYATKTAQGVKTADELMETVQTFIRNGLKEPAPKPKAPETLKWEETRVETTINGIIIVMTSTGPHDYYLSFPGLDTRKVRNQINPEDGKIYVGRNSSAYFEKAKKLATQGNSREDIFVQLKMESR